MPIINLTIDGKTATGDGTKIVCMNADYIVHIVFRNCDDFLNLPIKKLSVRYGMECADRVIPTIYEDDNGQKCADVSLPILVGHTDTYLGVVGWNIPDAEELPTVLSEAPYYVSQPARFECVKSAVCGAVVPKDDAKLGILTVAHNGIYSAGDQGLDGYATVNVEVASPIAQEATADLNFSGEGTMFMTVYPSDGQHTLSQVKIQRPVALYPQNIVKDVNIAGVVGTYEVPLSEKTVTENGEYPAGDGKGFSKVTVNVVPLLQEKTVSGNGDVLPDSGYYGLSKVTVAIPENVPSYQTKTITANGTYSADAGYDAIGSVTVDVPIPAGYINPTGTQTVTANGTYDVRNKETVVVNIPDNHLPVELATEYDMVNFLTTAPLGAVCKYTGPDGAFTSGAIYLVEEPE